MGQTRSVIGQHLILTLLTRTNYSLGLNKPKLILLQTVRQFKHFLILLLQSIKVRLLQVTALTKLMQHIDNGLLTEYTVLKKHMS